MQYHYERQMGSIAKLLYKIEKKFPIKHHNTKMNVADAYIEPIEVQKCQITVITRILSGLERRNR